MSFQEELKKIEDRYYKKEWKQARQELKERLLSRPIVLYGLGFFGGVIVKNFANEGISVQCFCDSKKHGIDAETGLKILSPQELTEQYSDANIVISVANPSTEKSVYHTVLSLGFGKKQIFSFQDAYQFMRKSRVEQVSLTLEELREYLDGYARSYDSFADENSRKVILETINNYLFHQLFTYEPPQNSYFPEAFTLCENEIFIDGGLYTGDTTEKFIERMGGKYARIIGFDIDEKNLAVARENLKAKPGVEIIPKGLWNCTAVMDAELGIMAGSNVKEGASAQVELTDLDSFFSQLPKEDYPTFIKLDVEGSEKQALLGAEKIIREASPKLAVCAYHKPEDLYVLPELIKQLNPQYQFFLKHYSPYIWDTVLYAYREEN